MVRSVEKLYAVSLINFFDNELRTVFVITSGGEMEAFKMGLVELTCDSSSDLTEEEQERLKADIVGAYADCKTLADAKELSFNMDSMIDVKQYRRSEAVE